MIRKNLIIIIATLILYFVNQTFKCSYPNGYFSWFMNCYFNDIIGGITFIAYTNIFFELHNQPTKSLLTIELVLLGCGLFWEIVTPIYRKNTVGDFWDIIAYLFGGFWYWILIKKLKNN